MTVGHLLFAAVTTAYILVAIQLEERDLVDLFGDDYRRYRHACRCCCPGASPPDCRASDRTRVAAPGSPRCRNRFAGAHGILSLANRRRTANLDAHFGMEFPCNRR